MIRDVKVVAVAVVDIAIATETEIGEIEIEIETETETEDVLLQEDPAHLHGTLDVPEAVLALQDITSDHLLDRHVEEVLPLKLVLDPDQDHIMTNFIFNLFNGFCLDLCIFLMKCK